MSMITRWAIVLLGLMVFVLISLKLANTDLAVPRAPANAWEPSYQSGQTSMMAYNLEGRLNYKLLADHVSYSSEEKFTWFTYPVATTFDKNNTPSWRVKAAKAKLTQGRMLYLYGHVQLDDLNDVFQIKRITTDNAVINLVTQDIFSDNEVTLYGNGFHSTGTKMRGNLRNKIAELIEKVKTSYEVHKSESVH
ncbi:MAG: LPS export ABC transporter periplasmic protein LptC [Sodalis sp. (in: enterobacteria)]